MRCMTVISPEAESAREDARHTSGQFGEQQHSAPELSIHSDRTTLSVIATALLPKAEPVPYPAELPPGGKIEAAFEDNGGVYVSIEFEDHLDKDGATVRLALGGDPDRGDDWNSIANDEPGFADDNLNDHALAYLREVRNGIDSDVGVASYAAVGPHLEEFIARATKPAEKPDYSDEASLAASQKRGERLVSAFADGGNELEDNVADALADILAYAKAQGLDIDELARRGVSYNEED